MGEKIDFIFDWNILEQNKRQRSITNNFKEGEFGNNENNKISNSRNLNEALYRNRACSIDIAGTIKEKNSPINHYL